MEPRKLAATIVAILNDGAERIEKLIAADGDEEGDAVETTKDKKKAGKTPPSRNTRSTKKKDEDEDDDDKDDDDDDDDDDDADDANDDKVPTEADIVKAVRGALKVLEKEDVVKHIKKHGKAEKATDVKPERRAAVIEALEQAVIDES